MILVEDIAEETRTMLAASQQQLPDYELSFEQKEQRLLEADMDAVIAENLPALKALAQ